MIADPSDVQQFISKIAAADCNPPPASVSIHAKNGVLLAEIDIAGVSRKIVVKSTRNNTHLNDPQQLLELHRRICSRDERIARAMPKLLAAQPHYGWLAMEFVEGPTLLAILKESLRKGRRHGDLADQALDDLAMHLSAINRLNADEIGLPPQRCSNRRYLEDFKRAYVGCTFKRFLPPHLDTVEKFYARLPSAFFERTRQQLSLVDCQPKNVIVGRDGRIRFIDIDYCAANPALGLAHFLIGLDRIGLRRPLPRALHQIEQWKRRFLHAYFNRADRCIAEDLAFFYPATLMRVYRWQINDHRWLRPYLTFYYGRRLRQFLQKLPSSDGTVSVAPAAQ